MSQKKPHKWLVLAVLCLSVFLVVVDNTIVNVALPSLSAQLNASNSALQWIVDAYSLPFAGFLLAGGGLSDRLGRKKVMQGGLVFFAIFSAMAAWSQSSTQLISMRALMGLAAAFIFPATLSILTITFTDARDRAKAYGIWGATSGLAVAFGPLTGGALIEHFWWGSVFLVNLPVVALTIVAGQLVIPESKSEFNRRFDFTGLFFGSAGITLLVLAIIEGPTWGWRSATTLSLFATAAILFTGFVLWERRRPEPLLDVRVFSKPAFSAGAVAIATSFFCLFGFIFLVTQYFQLVRGYSAFSAGAHTLPFAITSMIMTPLGALLALKIGTRTVVGSGLVIMS
ncbi:MAG: MFS transporter, partial [Actinobacteria bacterium]|nr:MFS transporter [Actinomycetota bacterium]